MDDESKDKEKPPKPKLDFYAESRERDRLRRLDPEYLKRRQALFDQRKPPSWIEEKVIFIKETVQSALGLDWWINSAEDKNSGIGIEWWQTLDRPLLTLYREDRDYYSGIVFEFVFLRKRFCIEKLLKKQKYRNIEQYIVWLKDSRKTQKELDKKNQEQKNQS